MKKAVNHIGRKAIHDVLDEMKAQDNKWGADRDQDPLLWNTILGEEAGELNTAVLHDMFGGKHAGEARMEAVQVAAVALQIVEQYDRGVPTANAYYPEADLPAKPVDRDPFWQGVFFAVAELDGGTAAEELYNHIPDPYAVARGAAEYDVRRVRRHHDLDLPLGMDADYEKFRVVDYPHVCQRTLEGLVGGEWIELYSDAGTGYSLQQRMEAMECEQRAIDIRNKLKKDKA